MLKLFYAPTTATNKVAITLEELKVPYSTLHFNIKSKIQLSDEYVSLVPTNKIPAIIDENGTMMFESGAIMLHLAEKYGQLIPQNNKQEFYTWFFWELSELTAKFTSFYRITLSIPENKEALLVISQDIHKSLKILDNQLKDKNYIIGDFSLIDISAFTWIKAVISRGLIENLLNDYENIQTWLKLLEQRDSFIKISKISEEFDWEKETNIEQVKEFIKNK